MNKFILKQTSIFLLTGVIVLLLSCTLSAAENDWPREFFSEEGKLLMYQPQLESFQEDKLTARAVVSVMQKGETDPTFGVIWFKARVATDRSERLVKILDIDITNIKLPVTPDPAKVEEFSRLLKSQVDTMDLTISLDRLLAMLEL